MVQQNPYQPPVADAPPAAEPSLSDGQYEFGHYENAAIDKVAGRARIWGMISLITGVLCLIGAIGVALFGAKMPAEVSKILLPIALAVLLPMGIVYLVRGKLYMDSGAELKQVVATQGNDVELMMRGINKMAGAFRIETIMTVVALVVGFVIGLTMGDTSGLDNSSY